MLLILRASKRKLHITNLTNGCHAPATTALRHARALEREGLIELSDDRLDQRRRPVRLTVLGRDKLDAYEAALASVESLAA